MCPLIFDEMSDIVRKKTVDTYIWYLRNDTTQRNRGEGHLKKQLEDQGKQCKVSAGCWVLPLWAWLSSWRPKLTLVSFLRYFSSGDKIRGTKNEPLTWKAAPSPLCVLWYCSSQVPILSEPAVGEMPGSSAEHLHPAGKTQWRDTRGSLSAYATAKQIGKYCVKQV